LIAVAGATGRLGQHLVEVIEGRGHDAVPISRTHGVDVITGAGLADALVGVDCIIDAATGPSPDREEASRFFTTAKLAHEEASLAGPIPVRILRAAQFHEFVGQLLDWGTQGEVGYVQTMRTQLVSARSVAEKLVDMATDPAFPAVGGSASVLEIAGPREESLVDAATLLAARRGRPTKVEGVTNSDDPDAVLMANGALLPGPGAILVGPSFEDWLEL